MLLARPLTGRRKRITSCETLSQLTIHPCIRVFQQTPTAQKCHIGQPLTTVCRRSCGKVLFSFVCVCQSVYPQGVPCEHYPFTHDALDFTI